MTPLKFLSASVVLFLCVCPPQISFAGSNPDARLAMHLVASDQVLDCQELMPTCCDSINVDLSVAELLAAGGYGYIALVAYDVEGITGVEFALDGWPSGRGAPTLTGPTWCEDALSLGDHGDGGGITAFEACVEPDSTTEIAILAYWRFGPLDSTDLPIDLSIVPSMYSDQDSLLVVLDCTLDYEQDDVVAVSGCAVGRVYLGTGPDCPGEEDGGGGGDGAGPDGPPIVSFLGPPIQRAHNAGSVFALTVSNLPQGMGISLERDGISRPVAADLVFDNVLECRAATTIGDIGAWDVVMTGAWQDYELRLPRVVRLAESPARLSFETGEAECVPGVVGAKIRHWGLSLPLDVEEASPDHLTLCSDGLQQVLATFSVSTIERVFKGKSPSDTLAYPGFGGPVRVDDLSRYYRLTFPMSVDLGDILAALEPLPEVMQVWPIGRKSYDSSPTHPNDSLYVLDEQWNLNNAYPATEDADVDMPEAWSFGQVSEGPMVAVLDMGIYYEHEDLAATSEFPNWKVTCGHNFVDPGEDPDDPYDQNCPGGISGHGTFVAGIAAAETNNDSTGIAGVAWGNTQLAAINIGTCYTGPQHSAEGIVYAIDSCGADVINMSYSGPTQDADERAAAHYANAHWAFQAAAAGNQSGHQTRYPAGLNYVVGVAMTDNTCQWAGGTRGPQVDIAALGSNVLSTKNTTTSTYGLWTGTSFATPHVAGLAAILGDIAERRGFLLHPDDILGLQCAGADTVRAISGYPNETVGWGKINAEKTVERLFWPYNNGQGPSRYTANGYDASYSDSIFVWGDTTYYRMCTKKLVHFTAYQDTPFVWGCSWYATLGSIRDAHDVDEMQLPWCRSVPNTATASSCSLKTYLYYRTMPGKSVGEWVTHSPEELVWGYSVSGIPSALGVDEIERSDFLASGKLSMIYPNPFNPNAVIAFNLDRWQRTKLAVYDARGRLVRVLLDDLVPAGPHKVQWDGSREDSSPVGTGVYFYRLETAEFTDTGKMILIR